MKPNRINRTCDRIVMVMFLAVVLAISAGWFGE